MRKKMRAFGPHVNGIGMKLPSCSTDGDIDGTPCFPYAYVLFPFRPKSDRANPLKSPCGIRDLGA